MKIFIDENLPPLLAKGLNSLEAGNAEGVDVLSIKEYFGAGTPDEIWIPEIGKIGGIVITQDYNIHRKKMQQELYRQHKVGLVIFKAPKKTGYTYWEMVENIIKHWKDIKGEVRRNKPPFVYVITPRSAHIEKL